MVLHTPMVLPRYAPGASMGYQGASMGRSWCFHRAPVVPPWYAQGASMGLHGASVGTSMVPHGRTFMKPPWYDTPMCFHGAAMVFHGALMACFHGTAWCFHGTSKRRSWCFLCTPMFAIPPLLRVLPWDVQGPPWDVHGPPWDVHGASTVRFPQRVPWHCHVW